MCVDVHFNGILFIKRGLWSTGSRFLDISIEIVLELSTSRLLICFKSLLNVRAAVFGFSTIINRLVSSTKSLKEQ